MTVREKSAYWLVPLLVLGVWLAGCSSAAPATSTPEGQALREKAALEATAIVERAEATAIVLRAQSTAAALIQSASGPTSTPAPTSAPAPMPSAALASQAPTVPAPIGAASPLPAPAETVTATGETGAAGVELLGVSFGADGAYIYVQYKASPKVADKFWPGVLSVVDEATGTVYNEVPVMPVIGPLIARPKQEGQMGYVMLVNAPPGLRSGSIVTVILADFRQEHVTVQ
jgi:hypothetical protein